MAASGVASPATGSSSTRGDSVGTTWAEGFQVPGNLDVRLHPGHVASASFRICVAAGGIPNWVRRRLGAVIAGRADGCFRPEAAIADTIRVVSVPLSLDAHTIRPPAPTVTQRLSGGSFATVSALDSCFAALYATARDLCMEMYGACGHNNVGRTRQQHVVMQ